MPSALRPVPHGSDVLVPILSENLPEIDGSASDSNERPNIEEYKPGDSCAPELFSQSELNDLVRDLHLTKENSELLGSRLKEKNLLAAGTSFSWFRYREKNFLPYFSEEGELVFCTDVRGLLNLTFRTKVSTGDCS